MSGMALWSKQSPTLSRLLHFVFPRLRWLSGLLVGMFCATFSWANDPKSWQIASPYLLSEEIVTQDITCNHAELTIQAEVLGQIFSVGCDLIVGGNGLLYQGIIFSGGQLKVESNAEIFGDITQIGGTLKIMPEANLSGTVNRYQHAVQPPKDFLAISQHYLTFQRIVPNNLAHLMRAAQELRLHRIIEKKRQRLESFSLPQFLDFLFQKGQIRFAQKWSYEKNTHPIELQIVEFASPEKAFQFWKNILTFTNLDLEHSVQNGLGEGGHWFFRHQNRSTLIWYRKSWIFSAQIVAGPQWLEAEKALNEMIRTFQQSLIANTSRLDLGDRFIGAFSLSSTP